MPLYEYESPSGRIYEDLYAAEDCPAEIEREEDGVVVRCRKIVSQCTIHHSVAEIREQEISGDRDEQIERFFAPDKRNGYNPKTKRFRSDAERLASGDPTVRASKGTKALLDKRVNELRGAV